MLKLSEKILPKLLDKIPEKKCLALVFKKELKNWEKFSKINIGAQKPFRPLIFWKTKIGFKFILLTTKRKKFKIDLSLCQKSKQCKPFLYSPFSFVMENQEGKIFCFILKDVRLFSKLIYCGICENLEFLDNLETEEYLLERL